MKSVAGTEIILTIGTIVAVGIVLVQLKGIFYGQQIFSQAEAVATFAKDLEDVVEKAIGTTGDAAFVYYPSLKKYSVDISNNIVLISDKTSGKNASFSKFTPEIAENYFEDCDKIFVVKKEDKIVVTCRCYENGEKCKSALVCCSGYCNETTAKCDKPPICPKELACPGATMASTPGGNAWKDLNGTSCCPSNDIGDISGPVCSSSHCCPTQKPKWCNKPQNGEARCVDDTEYKDEKCEEEICSPESTRCFNQWHDKHFGGTVYINQLHYICDIYEVCHPIGVLTAAKESVECCNNRCSGNCHSMCNKAVTDSGLSSTDTPETRKKCYGYYAIYGLGPASRWMHGYQIHIEGPASIMMTEQVWMCTGYAIAVATLLRSVGYAENEAYGTCAPGHMFNMVKFPGEDGWRFVDTVGNGLYISGITGSDWYGPRCMYGDCGGCSNDAGVFPCPTLSQTIGRC